MIVIIIFDLINRAMLSYRDCRVAAVHGSVWPCLWERAGTVTSLAVLDLQPEDHQPRESFYHLQEERMPEIYLHTWKKKHSKGDCQTDHFWIAFYDTLFYRRWKSQSSNNHNPCIKSSNLNLQCENTQTAVIQTLPCTHSQLIRLINTL